jgi:hypothetical protein
LADLTTAAEDDIIKALSKAQGCEKQKCHYQLFLLMPEKGTNSEHDNV